MEFVVQRGGVYEVTEECAALLQSMPQSLTVVGVAGTYRQGKSTLLNRLLGGEPIFATSGSTKSQTKGLWIAPWRDNVLLLDCEGLGSSDASDEHDFNLFALCVLLCSCFLYNNVGPITSSALQALRLAGKLANLLKSSGKMKLSPPTSLIWVARDFNLNMVDANGAEIDANAYLEQNIGANAGLLELFPVRSCFTLPRPATEDRDVTNMQNLTAPFTQGIQALSRSILETAIPKQCNGVTLTGPLLLVLATTLVDAINRGQTHSLNLMPVWDTAVHSREVEAQTLARNRLEAESKDAEEDPLDVLHAALQIYNAHAIEPNAEGISTLVKAAATIWSQKVQRWTAIGTIDTLPVPSLRVPVCAAVQRQTLVLQEQLKAAEESRRNLESESTQQLMQHQTLLKTRKRQHEDLQSLHQDFRTQVEQELTQTKSDIVQLSSRLAGFELTCQELTDENAELRKTLRTSTCAAMSLRSRLERAEPELQRSVKELEQYRTGFTLELETLQTERAHQRDEIETLRTRLAHMCTESLRNQQTLESLQRTHREEVESYSELLCKEQREKGALMQDIERCRKELCVVQTDLAVSRAREQEAMESSKRQRMTLSQSPELVEHLKSEHVKDQEFIARLQKELEELTRQKIMLQLQNLKHTKQPNNPSNPPNA